MLSIFYSSNSNKLRMDVELFDLLSDNAGEIDHPLCEECTDTILENMDQQLKLSEEEAQQYHSFLQKLEGESEDDGYQVQQLQKELSGNYYSYQTKVYATR